MRDSITIALAVFVAIGLLVGVAGPAAAQDTSPDTGVDGDDQSDAVLTDNGIANQTDGGGIVSLLEFLFDNLNISISIDG